MTHALPDDVVVAIFDFYQGDAMHRVLQRVEVVLPGARMSKMAPYCPCITCHLCLQRFHRLILPARISPDSWPPLPIIIHYLPLHAVGWPEENTVATFEHEIDKAYATTCSSVAMKLSLP